MCSFTPKQLCRNLVIFQMHAVKAQTRFFLCRETISHGHSFISNAKKNKWNIRFNSGKRVIHNKSWL